jgi:hypothetical protein
MLLKGVEMKRIVSFTVLPVALVLCAAVTAPAKTKKPRHSAEHTAAINKCNDDYNAAVKQAKTRKGQEAKDAKSAASKAHKQCISAAPA